MCSVYFGVISGNFFEEIGFMVALLTECFVDRVSNSIQKCFIFLRDILLFSQFLGHIS